MIRLPYKLRFFIYILPIVVGVGMVLLPGKAFAAVDIYPQGTVNGTYKYTKFLAASNSAGGAVSLNAPNSFVKINFSPDTEIYQLDFIDICFENNGFDYSANGVPSSCGTGGNVTVKVYGSDSAGLKDSNVPPSHTFNPTESNPQITFRCVDAGCDASFAKNINAPVNKYGYRTIYISVTQNVGGLNGYKIRATGFQNGTWTIQGDQTAIGVAATLNVASNSYPQTVMHLPLSNAQLGAGYNSSDNAPDVTFTFKTPCKAASSFQVGWFDADRGVAGQPDDLDITWKMTNKTTNQSVSAETAVFLAVASGKSMTMESYMGGNNEFRSATFSNSSLMSISEKNSFEWRWQKANWNNGVQVLLPYSDADVILKCPDNNPPEGTMNFSCATGNITGNAWDDDFVSDAYGVRIYKNGVQVLQTLANRTTPYTYAFDKASTTTVYRLDVQNVRQDGSVVGWVTIKSVTPNCPASTTLICDFTPQEIQQGETFKFSITLTADNRATNYTRTNNKLGITLKQNNASGVSTNIYGPLTDVAYADFGSNPKSRTITSPDITATGTGRIAIDVTFTNSGAGLTNNQVPGCDTDLNNGDIIKEYAKPYVSFYEGDVCTLGRIDTFFDATKKVGSGSQLATFANDIISGFATAKMRASTPTQPDGLTFSNTATPKGQFDAPPCIDVNDSRYDQPLTQIDGWEGIARVTVNSNKKYAYTGCATQNLVLAQSAAITIPKGAQVTLYVPCDLVITNNINYGTSYASLTEVPSFTVIVQGNIYLNSSVTELNGTYIARGDNDANKGVIYTCTDGAQSIADDWNNLRTNCSTQLKVYGALYANKIRWWRMSGTLLNGTPTESYTSTNPAEVIVNDPLRYIRPTIYSTESMYDSYTSLSPIL